MLSTVSSGDIAVYVWMLVSMEKTTIKIPKSFTLVMHLCRALTMIGASRTGSALHESVTESLGRDSEDLELYCVAR